MTEMLEYRCRRDRDAPARARAVLTGLLGGLEPHVARDVKLMVSELVTNAVRHGEGDTTLVVHRGERQLNVTVSDEGDDQPKLRTPSADGGWGLRIVDSCATRWGVEEASKHVWFEVDLEGSCES